MAGYHDERDVIAFIIEFCLERVHLSIKIRKQNILLPVLQCYQPADVFNADETGLFWHPLPDKTHSVSGEVCGGGKRVTVLVCANMDGTE